MKTESSDRDSRPSLSNQSSMLCSSSSEQPFVVMEVESSWSGPIREKDVLVLSINTFRIDSYDVGL